jgi:hypothetical protein
MRQWKMLGVIVFCATFTSGANATEERFEFAANQDSLNIELSFPARTVEAVRFVATGLQDLPLVEHTCVYRGIGEDYWETNQFYCPYVIVIELVVGDVKWSKSVSLGGLGSPFDVGTIELQKWYNSGEGEALTGLLVKGEYCDPFFTVCDGGGRPVVGEYLTTIEAGSVAYTSGPVVIVEYDDALPNKSSSWGAIKAIYR